MVPLEISVGSKVELPAGMKMQVDLQRTKSAASRCSMYPELEPVHLELNF